MNPRLLLIPCIALAIALTQPASAQSVSDLYQLPHKVIAHRDAKATYEYLMQRLAARNSAQKTTGTISRLIANSTSQAGLHGDTSYYRYTSNDRGGDDGSAYLGTGLRVGLQSDTGTNMLWSGATSAYVPNQRILKTFDAQHRELTSTLQGWTNGAWRNQFRVSIFRNAAGHDTLVISENWNSSTSAWVNSYRDSYTYNSNGDVTNSLSQTWNTSTSAWVNASRSTTTYDASGNEIMFFAETWNTTTSSWVASSRTTYTYNSANSILSSTNESWNTATSTWAGQYQYLYSYNASNHLTTIVSKSFLGSNWVNTDSTAYPSLTATGQPLTSLTYNWVSSAWNPIYRITDTYTSAGLQSTSVTESWNGSAYVNSRRSFTFYNSYDQRTRQYSESWNGSAWVVATSNKDERFYYETVTTGIAKGGAQSIQAYLFPVPATQQLTLSMQWPAAQRIGISLRDVWGKELKHWEERVGAGVYTKELSVEALPAGTYFLRVQGTQEGWSGSFSVVR